MAILIIIKIFSNNPVRQSTTADIVGQKRVKNAVDDVNNPVGGDNVACYNWNVVD